METVRTLVFVDANQDGGDTIAPYHSLAIRAYPVLELVHVSMVAHAVVIYVPVQWVMPLITARSPIVQEVASKENAFHQTHVSVTLDTTELTAVNRFVTLPVSMEPVLLLILAIALELGTLTAQELLLSAVATKTNAKGENLLVRPLAPISSVDLTAVPVLQDIRVHPICSIPFRHKTRPIRREDA